MKLKTIYNCGNCGYQSSKWIGRCPQCDAWNSFVEDVVEKNPQAKVTAKPISTSSLMHEGGADVHIDTKIEELNRVLGGGLMKGGMVLLSGEPGIGKSTLTLQLCHMLAESGLKVLYISGEESQYQVSMRSQRLGFAAKAGKGALEFLAETNMESIVATIENMQPDCVILDSIQVVYSSELPSMAGSINQVRFCTEQLMHYAKKTATAMVLIGHVTKDGTLAGPRVLEHLVDTVLFLEGERYQHFRLLRSMKNRFGPTYEVGVFEMDEEGMKEVKNPSNVFLEGRKEGAFGSAITATVEGTRPFLLEVQALTNTTVFGYPKRAGSGFDLNRLQLLLAVIQKHLKLNLSNQDVYVNVVGGFKLSDPAADLAVVMAVISSFGKKPLGADTLYLGEVGLAGELRPVMQLQKRIQEADKMGFKKVVVPKSSQKLSGFKKIEVQMVEDIGQLLKAVA